MSSVNPAKAGLTRPAPSTSIPYQKRSMSTHPSETTTISNTSTFNPPRSQTRSMTKLAQNRKHLESYVQAERNGGRTVFGGVVKGKRGVLLDSLKNVQGSEVVDEDRSTGTAKPQIEHRPGTAQSGTTNQSKQPGSTVSRVLPGTPPRSPRPDKRPPLSTLTEIPALEIKPGGFKMDDSESEDELLLTPRRKEKRRQSGFGSSIAPTRTTMGPTGTLGFGPGPGSLQSRGSTLASSSTMMLSSGSHDEADDAMQGLKREGLPLPQIKRKRPANPSDSPTNAFSPRAQAALRTNSDRDAGSPSPSSRRVRSQTEGPSIDTPERRHKGKRRRVSDSPSKILGQRVSIDDTLAESGMDKAEVGTRFAGAIVRPPTPPRRRAGEPVRQGTEGKKRTMGTLPNALGGPRSRTGREMEVDTVQPNKISVMRPALGQARTNGSTTAIPSHVARKPSYPSSLGSGSAPPRQIMRAVSSATDDPMDATTTPSTTTMTTGGFRVASRREGLGSDTRGSLYGLSAALAKLQVKASSGPTSSSTTPGQVVSEGDKRRLGGFAMPTASSTAKSIADPARVQGPGTLKRSSTMSMGQRRISSLSTVAHEPTPSFSRAASVAPESGLVRSGTIANLIESDAGTGCLKGVVAYVDVRTAEGDDAGTIFVDMLKFCGAKVLAKPTESCTHIVYKSGKSSTMAWYRRQEDPKPYLVGISWVTRCKEAGERIDEKIYAVNPEEIEMFKKRRRSMEPKQLRALIAAGNGLAPEEAPMTTLRRLSGQ